MAEERSDIKLDGNIASWELNSIGPILGTYTGTFKFRAYLTPLQQIAAGREEREILGDNLSLAPEHERFLAYALTQLKYRIISAPPFWTSANSFGGLAGDIPDEEIISLVLSAAIDSESKYKSDIKKRKEEAITRAKQANETMIKKEMEDREENEKIENGEV